MVFTTDSTATTQEDQNNETQGQETPKQESFLDKLVQAKGENWKDPEVLAKGKLEADNYIQQLEEQNRQLREDLGKNDYAAQVLEEPSSLIEIRLAVLKQPGPLDGVHLHGLILIRA